MTAVSRTRTAFVVEFAQPGATINMNHRLHWAVKAALTAGWRRAAGAHVRLAGRHRSFPEPRSEVHVSFPVASVNLRRDAHNWFPTVKAIIDGCVDAGVWPDDSGEWVVTVEPSFHARKVNPFVVVTIAPAARGETT